MIIAEQPSLSDEVRGLVWEWLIHWPWTSATGEDATSTDGEALVHSQEYEAELRSVTVNTSVFDSNGMYHCCHRERLVWVVGVVLFEIIVLLLVVFRNISLQV